MLQDGLSVSQTLACATEYRLVANNTPPQGRHGSLGENLLTSPTNDNSPFIRPTVLPRINSASQFTPMNAPGPQLTLNTSTKYEIPGFYVVIPAGGAGTRLWPLSRQNHPKFLLDVNLSGRSLLQSTWNRLVPLTGPSRMTVVAGPAHSDAIQIQLPQLEGTNLFTEPGPKDSMAAIGLAAAILAQRDPEAVIGSFAADHMISGEDAFLRAVTEAVHVAKTGKLVTIGIAPSHPATGFGYVKLGEELSVEGANSARLVDAFKEKPDARTAASYIASGNYRWNAGMFVTKAATLMELVKEHRPDIYAGLTKIAAVWDDESARGPVLEEVWPQLETIAIDNAIAEPAAADGKVAVIPATFGWDDVGDFSSLSEMLPADSNYPRILGESELGKLHLLYQSCFRFCLHSLTFSKSLPNKPLVASLSLALAVSLPVLVLTTWSLSIFLMLSWSPPVLVRRKSSRWSRSARRLVSLTWCKNMMTRIRRMEQGC